jgi:hypothetical protein
MSAVIGARLFAAAMAAFAASWRPRAPAVAVLALVRRYSKRPESCARDVTYGAPAKRAPTFSQTTAVASNNKSATYRQIALMAAISTDLTDALFPGSRARTLHVVVCLMGSFLTIAPRGGPIENFRQETHLERLASIDDRPRGHRMFARDNADRSLKFVEKSIVRLLIVSRHHRCARDSPSLWGRYPAGLPPPSTR